MRRSAIFAAAVAAGVTYCAVPWLGVAGPATIVWKGAGVGLLAVWAAGATRGADGRLIAAVLAAGALGDVLLDAAGLTVGAVAFLTGHLVAIALYRRNPYPRVRVVSMAIPVVTIALAAALTRDPGAIVYAAALGVMAGAAWQSRFPRRVAAGAALFVVSDLLIFARSGSLADGALPKLLVWPSYFAGQALIAHGVVTTLGRRNGDDDLHHRL